MVNLKSFLTKINSKKITTKISNTNPTIEINPQEIISFSKNYLLPSNCIELKTIGIILSSGIPLSSLNNENFTIISNFLDKDNIISYTLSSDLEIRKLSLVHPKLIQNSIYSLKNIHYSIKPWKLNRILKKLFLANITTKYLELIYYSILNSNYKQNNNSLLFFNNHRNKNSKSKLIKLVSKSTPFSRNQNLSFFLSFQSLRIHTPNLLFYKNSNHKIKSTIASLIENFFRDEIPNKNIHTLKSYINQNLKQIGIPYQYTNRIQKQIFANVFLPSNTTI
ncbi:hypothetical protein F9Y90_05405 (plasmid) [Borrelia miyamotoi]|uniref:Uncharacterized protein n=1 Tax=Borrelia miyamotoi TaxID=47466 RepID=A0AAQ3CMY2_9SPIR|nr:hypothetical protein [Borrelia miyamotoi]ATQ17873.1 hypothetical protein CNO12_06190 [Borrelia miyamotoi]ATQ21492.1 hypothetical protein CNO09_05375 [Borrelia miyamotoi]ATQ21551.1 hypothetical protein CNO09_05700 [Borrelia miyamotoi]QBK63973.1 hypothetical protein EZU68_06250 [Borrelia miyamotoi]QBK66489.1 hypothetical protein EZU70_06070 [Borrelia miyamotoi]